VWNPVKELKDIASKDQAVSVIAAWNPVKELKVLCCTTMPTSGTTCVESGEGIERPVAFSPVPC